VSDRSPVFLQQCQEGLSFLWPSFSETVAVINHGHPPKLGKVSPLFGLQLLQIFLNSTTMVIDNIVFLLEGTSLLSLAFIFLLKKNVKPHNHMDIDSIVLREGRPVFSIHFLIEM
jgi:hypothetical protein